MMPLNQISDRYVLKNKFTIYHLNYFIRLIEFLRPGIFIFFDISAKIIVLLILYKKKLNLTRYRQ